MSAFLLTELFAIKKGFTTARTSRPDTYRAANMILRYVCMFVCSKVRKLNSKTPYGNAWTMWLRESKMEKNSNILKILLLGT